MTSETIPVLCDVEEAVALPTEERATRKALLERQLELLRQAMTLLGAEAALEGHTEQVDLNGRGLFNSAHFSDLQIIEQLLSTKHQTDLTAHRWPELENQGPCFKSLARALKDSPPEGLSASLKVLTVALESQRSLHGELRHFLGSRIRVVAQAMREIAESYLSRSLPKPKMSESDHKLRLPQSFVLKGSKGIYRPVHFVNSGSAGLVYSAVSVTVKADEATPTTGSKWQVVSDALTRESKLPSALDVSSEVVLKRINATQKDSAENEFRIATKIAVNGGHKYAIPYLDRIVEEDTQQLWLVLERVQPSIYGIDLNEYISNGFFQQPTHVSLSQSVVLQLLAGLAHVAAAGVVMRDVKPDNVLIQLSQEDGSEPSVLARWSDFGLAVDLSQNGNQLRRPRIGNPDDILQQQLVGWWYDTQKQVPKPKWENRCPPEKCYLGDSAFAFDIYMMGIIICCIATGIDFPHLGTKAIDAEVQRLLGIPLAEDYLKSFELGQVVGTHEEVFWGCFTNTFGAVFGEALLRMTRAMLATDPAVRPTAEYALSALAFL